MRIESVYSLTEVDYSAQESVLDVLRGRVPAPESKLIMGISNMGQAMTARFVGDGVPAKTISRLATILQNADKVKITITVEAI